MTKAAKKIKRKKKNSPRRLKWPTARVFFVFAALLVAVFVAEISFYSRYRNKNLRGHAPEAVLVLEETKPIDKMAEQALCYLPRLQQSLLEQRDDDFLYNDSPENVNIATAEEVDAEYLSQVLFMDEEATDISYQIAGMVDDGVSTKECKRLMMFGTIFIIWKGMISLNISLTSFMRRICQKTK